MLRFLVWGHLKSQDQTSLVESLQEVIARCAIKRKRPKFWFLFFAPRFFPPTIVQQLFNDTQKYIVKEIGVRFY